MLITAAVYTLLALVLSASPPARPAPEIAALVRALPTVIAVINLAALAFLLAGWRAARARRIGAHRGAMLAAAACISLFLVLYVTRVALGGVKSFAGPPAVRTYVYLPVLAVHVLLSILSVPLVVHNLLIGLAYRRADIRRTRHPQVGRWAVLLWSVSLALGLLVYLLLNVLYDGPHGP